MSERVKHVDGINGWKRKGGVLTQRDFFSLQEPRTSILIVVNSLETSFRYCIKHHLLCKELQTAVQTIKGRKKKREREALYGNHHQSLLLTASALLSQCQSSTSSKSEFVVSVTMHYIFALVACLCVSPCVFSSLSLLSFL